MIKVYQSKKDKKCFSACIASLLHLKLEDVPVFCDHENWVERCNKWLESYNLFYMDVMTTKEIFDALSPRWGYHIISGDSVREIRHSVIGYKGEIVHDPYPDGDGKLTGQIEFGFLIPLDPSVRKG